MKGMNVIGWLAIVFGILVIALPHLLNDLVALFFILIGLNILVFNRTITKL